MHRAAQMQRTASSSCNDAGKQLLENLVIIAGRLAVGVGRNSNDRKGAQQAGLPTNVFNSFLLK